MAGLSYRQAVSAAKKLILADRALAPGNRPILCAGSRPGKVSVLILHGFSASPYECADLAKDLRSRGYRVFVPRIAGHGAGREEFEGSRLDSWMASAEQGFQIARGLGKRVALIGQSGGGNLASLLASRHPGELASLVLACPAFRLGHPLAPFSRFRLVQRLVPEVSFPADKPDLAAHWILRYGSFMGAELVRAGGLASRAALGLTLPLALVQAGQDPVISAPFNTRLFRSIPSADKQAWTYPSREHNVLHHHNPIQSQVFDWIAGFLDRTTLHSKGAQP